MSKSLKDRVLDNFAEDLMTISQPWFYVTDFVPRCVGNFTHFMGRWIYGKGMVLRDRNEDWLKIDARFAEESKRTDQD
jgi:hypothetical protein